MDVSALVESMKQAIRDVSAFMSEVSMSPSWLVKSLLLVALSCSLPYAVLAYYGERQTHTYSRAAGLAPVNPCIHRRVVLAVQVWP